MWFEPKRASPHKAGGKINGWNRGCKANTVNQESGFSFIWCGWLVGGFHTYDCASFGICMNTRGSAHNIISLSLYPTSKPLLIPSPFCVLFFLIWPGSTLSLLLDYALRLRVVREREKGGELTADALFAWERSYVWGGPCDGCGPPTATSVSLFVHEVHEWTHLNRRWEAWLCPFMFCTPMFFYFPISHIKV